MIDSATRSHEESQPRSARCNRATGRKRALRPLWRRLDSCEGVALAGHPRIERKPWRFCAAADI